MHARRHLITGAFLAAALTIGIAAPASADGTGDAWTDGKNIGAGATAPGTSAPSAGGRSSQPVCEWKRLEPEHAAMADHMAENGTGPEKGDGPGAWFHKICTDAGGSSAIVLWVPDRVDPRVLAQRAAEQVPIPDPAIRINPSPSEGAVVNVETWLWVDPGAWRAVTAQAAAAGVVVTATASPRRVIWNLGNGDTVRCNGPGTAYDASRSPSDQSTDCSYTYRRSSAHAPDGAFTVTATVVWQVTWSASGAVGGGSLGTVPRSQSVQLPVKEIQAVNQ
jgi:hypothetical protein